MQTKLGFVTSHILVHSLGVGDPCFSRQKRIMYSAVKGVVVAQVASDAELENNLYLKI